MTEKPEEGEQTPVQQCEQCVELNEKIQDQEEKLKEVEDEIQSLRRSPSLVQDLLKPLKPLIPNIEVLHVLVEHKMKISNYKCGRSCKTCEIMITTDKFESHSKKTPHMQDKESGVLNPMQRVRSTICRRDREITK